MKPKSVLEQLANQYTLPGGSFYMDEQGTIQTVENIADLKKYLMIKGATQVIYVKAIDRFVESDSSGVADEVTSWASTHPKRKGYRWVLQAVATASSSVAPYMDFNKEGGGTVRLTFGSEGQPIYTILSCLMLLFSSITGYAQSARTSPLIDRTTHVLAWPSDLWTTNAAAIAAALPAGSLGTNQLNAQTYGLVNLGSSVFGSEYLKDFRSRITRLGPQSTALPEKVSIALIGDSWTVNPVYASWLTKTLSQAYGSAGSGWLQLGSEYGTADTVLSQDNSQNSSASTSTLSGHDSPALGAWESSTIGDRVKVTKSVGPAATSVELHYATKVGGGSVKYRWGDGSWASIDTSGTNSYTVLNLSNVPTTEAWDLYLEVETAGTSGVTLYGLQAPTATTGTVVHNLGVLGANTADWVEPDSTKWESAFSTLAPSLVIIMLGTNDQGLTESEFRENLEALVARVQAATPLAGILLICPPENSTPTPTAMSLLAAQMKECALNNRCAFIDLQPLFGDDYEDYAYGSAKNYFYEDGYHLISGGVSILVSAVMEVIGLHGSGGNYGVLTVPGETDFYGGYLASELLTNRLFEASATDWTLGAGWSYSTGGIVHAASGGTSAATQAVTTAAANYYLIDYVVSARTNGSFSVAIGSVSKAGLIATGKTVIKGDTTGSVTFAITPTTDFDGRIESVSVGRILVSNSSAINAPGRITIRGDETLGNLFLGYNSGAYSMFGTENTGVGKSSVAYTIAGIGNSALGYESLMNNQGDYNSAFGRKALYNVTSGNMGVAVGALSSYNVTTGTDNTSVGAFGLYNITTGANNSSLGINAGRYQANGSTALTTASYSVYIGNNARGYNNSDVNSVVIAGTSGIGEGANTTVIGNANTTLTHLYGATRIILPSATNGLISGQLWNNAGTVSVMP